MYSGKENTGMMSDFLCFLHSQYSMKYLLNKTVMAPYTEPLLES